MYYITIWTGSHISAAHHNRYTYIYQAYLTRLSCYWLHWTKALLSKPLSTQISDNTQRYRVRYSCHQVHRLQKRISHRLGCTQIAKARISPSCSSSPLSPWAERVPFFASQCFKDNSKLQRKRLRDVALIRKRRRQRCLYQGTHRHFNHSPKVIPTTDHRSYR